jgi:putative Ca2+/H+ antiporter (TMEM165/GDT1 family)
MSDSFGRRFFFAYASGMDWKQLATTFGAVFIAELGDKTQLATLSLASGRVSRLSVFLGAASALVCTSLLAVMAGDAITRVVPPVWLRRTAGLIFVVLGVLYLLKPEG